MLLKDYSPVHVPETLAMQQFHFLLPDLLRFQSSLETAVKLLGEPSISHMPYRAAKDAEGSLRETAENELELQVGVMVARPAHEKSRSIKRYCQLAGLRQMSVERKYDGEYCQIHIDLNKPRYWIKIFSKSGKGSTSDRIQLHHPLQDNMKLDTVDCKIKRQYILEGELLVWNNDEKRIKPFHKICKYVQRSGRSLGTSRDEVIHQVKKEYIPGLGDTADFAVVAGRHDAKDE